VADPVQPLSRLRALPRNVRAASLASFLADVSMEMVLNLLPLFLANVLGVRTVVIGLIEGVAEATASLVNVQSGWLSDRLRRRKRLAVAGYAVSALAKPFFALATSWGGVAAARWGDRVGKGIRTAPRDALIAGSVPAGQRGLGRSFQPPSTTGSSETLGDVDYALRTRLPRRRRKSNPTARGKHRTGRAHTVRDGMPNRA
jgi:MFS family permease